MRSRDFVQGGRYLLKSGEIVEVELIARRRRGCRVLLKGSVNGWIRGSKLARRVRAVQKSLKFG